MKILIILALYVFYTSAWRIRLHSLPNPEDLSTPISEVNETSTNDSEIIRDYRETKIFPRLEFYENEDQDIQEEEESMMTRILISEDEDEIQAIIQSLPDESMAKLVIFSNALDYLHKIEDLLKHFRDKVDLEEDLTSQQRTYVRFKLLQIHALIDEAVDKAIPRDMKNVPFQFPREIY